MKNYYYFVIICMGILICRTQEESFGDVRIWQEKLTLPTYKVHPPDRNPMFRRPISYQGASRVVYPYPLQDNLSNQRIEQTYQALYLENEYIKLCILPELGGRLFYATDKTNNYELFYRQHVIKPANIGMLGAWISGGIEWCVFHHHRASTFLPVNYTLVENADGSKTVWIGEIEPRHRMKWSIGITLYPGKSYIEARIKMINRTEHVHSILYWANVATHANEHYQIFFPPQTQFGTYHAKNDFVHWPIAQTKYRGRNYPGVDLSWWKNHPRPISIFAHDLPEGFLAGYDHEQKAGTIHIANPHVVTGAKLWEWGPGPQGRMWDTKVLTDTDGPYAELMTGAYSDNQPDYSWIKSYEIKECKQYWYPLREINGVKAANLQCALNLEMISADKMKLSLNATQKYSKANIVVNAQEKILFQQEISINPSQPYTQEITLPAKVKETDLEAKLLVNDKLMITYKPSVKKVDSDLPPTVTPPLKPAEIKTNEELYLTGLRIKQFHNARLNPNDYFLEALKRDPDDSRCNVQMGLNAMSRGLYDEASKRFRNAIERITKDYTRPRNCEAFYYLGVIQKQLGKYEQAHSSLYRAVWDYSFRAAGYYQLAELCCLQNNYQQALQHLYQSLAVNSHNTRALNLKCAVLRKLGKPKKARNVITRTFTIDPLDFWARHERVLLFNQLEQSGKANRQLQELQQLLQDNPESYLELATDYMNAGFWDEAIDVLTQATRKQTSGLRDYPTIHYYLGYLFHKKGDSEQADRAWQQARQCPLDYCFPFRRESIPVLAVAIDTHPKDAKAHYYLGNLWYDRQPEKAIQHWHRAVTVNPSLAIVHRNLGWGYYYDHADTAKAIQQYEIAIEMNPQDPRYYYELDMLYERNNTPLEKRLALLEDNHEYVQKREDALIREIIVLVQAQKYDKAIDYLKQYFFHIQEGNRRLHSTFVDAHLLRGLHLLKEKKYHQAWQDFLQADTYLENHQIGRDENYERIPQIYYYTGVCAQYVDRKEDAEKYFRKVTKHDSKNSAYLYYQGMAFRQLGQEQKASKVFDELIRLGEEELQKKVDVDFFSKFGSGQLPHVQQAQAHFMIGLGCLGNNRKNQATQSFQKAITLDVNHSWARHFGKELSGNR
jgi:tetratricopeptide (TPR) repeat protein